MPRPGPRPYECVRRAWHSDRHQPIRGSLIQEIFRVVKEIHCPATQKNKEWQEKLPIVVLKAEEILYSKANSESEYMDPETLLDRTRDAINTIIRRDETTETGDLLHPCIEAALTLGCLPRRASRSQRNCSPQRYLNSCSQEKADLLKEIPTSDRTSLCPSIFLPKSNHYSKTHHPLVLDKVTLCNNGSGSVIRPHTPSGPYSVYPLYYGTNFLEAKSSSCKFQFLHDWTSKSSGFQNLESRVDKPNEERENGSEVNCDLSLHLGPHSVQVLAVRGPNSSTQVSKLGGERAQGNMHGDLQMFSTDISLKKRKLLYSSKYVEDQSRCNAML